MKNKLYWHPYFIKVVVGLVTDIAHKNNNNVGI